MDPTESEKQQPGSHKVGYLEDDGELEDGKEDKEEEMSLLGENEEAFSPYNTGTPASQIPGPLDSPEHPTPPEPIFNSSPGIPSPLPAVQTCNPTQPISDQIKRFPPLATPDPEIQIAEPESGKSSILVKTKSGVCGHNPVKLTTICLVALSMWIMVVLIMHLDKKVTAVTSSMSNVKDKLRTMEDTASSYRGDTADRLEAIIHKAGNILRSVRRKGFHSSDDKNTKLQQAFTPAFTTKKAILTAKHTTKHDVTTEHPKKTEEEQENEFFGAGWLDK